MTKPIDETSIAEAVSAMETSNGPSKDVQKRAVRALLAKLAAHAPGKTLEVRVPPYGAVQCVAGLRHTRGTPPNVVECDPVTFIGLAVGKVEFATAVADGAVTASGTRADLTPYLPLV